MSMIREKQLIKNTAIITFGKVCTQLMSFFLLPLYTSILTEEEYGIVDLVNTIVQLFLPIVTFQIEQSIFRFLVDSRKKEEETNEILSTSVIFTIISLIIYSIIYIIISGFISNQYKYYLLINLIATALSSIFLQMARGEGDNRTYAVGSFITALCTILFNIYFIVVLKIGVYGMLLASFISNIFCVLYIFIKKQAYRKIKLKYFKKERLKKLLKYSIPLMPNSISWWVLNASDRVIVTYMISTSATGILSVANKFPGVYMNIYTLFNMAWTESVALYINDADNEKYISNISNIIVKLFSFISFGIISAMPFVFNIIVNEKFNDAYNQIPILMIASIFNVIIGLVSTVYIAKKDTKAIAKTSIITAIINLIVDLLLIKFVGIYAATISTLVAYMIMAIYRYIDVKKYVNLNIEKKNIWMLLSIGSIVVTLYYINNKYLNILSLIICIMFGIICNIDSLKFLVQIYKGKMKNKGE